MSTQPLITPCRTDAQLDLALEDASRRYSGKRVFVPTMGYLHEGHICLVEKAFDVGAHVVVSIFVNPTQFNDPNDLARYPRDTERDCAMLSECVERRRAQGRQTPPVLVWLPGVDSIYSAGFGTKVCAGPLAELHCGAHRPGHFDGVATVVTILLNRIRPDVAIFGEKDFQQVRVIEQMVKDLRIPVSILRAPTVREASGLAKSSRNVRLSESGRRAAAAIFGSLKAARDRYRAGETDARSLESMIHRAVSEQDITPEYVSVVDETTLLPAQVANDYSRILFAGQLESVRLIDNLALRDS